MSEAAPLSISLNLAGVKTTVPVIADASWVKCRIANLSQKTHEKGQIINFEYHLLDPAPTADGQQVKPGFPLFENITLFDKNTPAGTVPEWAIQKISKRIDSVLGTGDPDNKAGKPARPVFDANLVPQLIGKELFIKVKVKTGDYTGNDIAETKFPGDVK